MTAERQAETQPEIRHELPTQGRKGRIGTLQTINRPPAHVTGANGKSDPDPTLPTLNLTLTLFFVSRRVALLFAQFVRFSAFRPVRQHQSGYITLNIFNCVHYYLRWTPLHALGKGRIEGKSMLSRPARVGGHPPSASTAVALSLSTPEPQKIRRKGRAPAGCCPIRHAMGAVDGVRVSHETTASVQWRTENV